MKTFYSVTLAELRESIRAKWFFLYSFIFGGMVLLLFLFGITESQVMGFTGLSRLMVTYIQVCVAILPIFILVTTVRSVVGERESNVLEYFLSMPISLRDYYWGKLLAKFLVIFLPVVFALLGAVIWGSVQSLSIPWGPIGYYLILLATLSCCFLGMGILISTLVRRQEWALGLAFLTWLGLLLFIDVIMIGLMLQKQVQEQVIVSLSLLNPIQVFRTGAILLFDPEFAVIGPAAYVILDTLGKQGFLFYSIAYPLALGVMFSSLGYFLFKRGDLI